MPEYDFFATVRSDVENLQNELAAPGVRDGIENVAQRFGVERDVALAALWRASKRHGETLGVFVAELADQIQRETARQSDAETAGAAETGTTAPRL
jgi:hypothetical protein